MVFLPVIILPDLLERKDAAFVRLPVPIISFFVLVVEFELFYNR